MYSSAVFSPPTMLASLLIRSQLKSTLVTFECFSGSGSDVSEMKMGMPAVSS